MSPFADGEFEAIEPAPRPTRYAPRQGVVNRAELSWVPHVERAGTDSFADSRTRSTTVATSSRSADQGAFRSIAAAPQSIMLRTSWQFTVRQDVRPVLTKRT